MAGKHLTPEDLTNSVRDTLLLKCKTTLEGLTADIDIERKARFTAERKIIALSRELNALQDELDTIRRREQDSMQDVQQEINENSQLKMRITGLEDRIRNELDEKDELRAKVETLIRELSTAQRLLDESRSVSQEKDAEMSQWSDLMTTAQDKLEQMAGDNDFLRSEKSRLIDNCDKLMTQNEKLEELLQKVRCENELLTGKIEQIREQYMEKLASLERDKALQHQSLSENFTQRMLKQYEDMQREHREGRLATAAVETENKRLSGENSRLTEESETLRRKCEELERELREAEKAHVSTSSELRTLHLDMDRLQRDYQQDLEFKTKTHAQAVARVDEELRAHEQTRRQVEDLAGKLANSELAREREKAEFNRKVENLTAELYRKTTECQEVRSEYEKCKKDWEEDLRQFKQETAKVHSEEIRLFQSKLAALESQLDQDRDSYQQEMQRLKDHYSSALLSSTDELSSLRTERNIFRGTVADLETRIAALTNRMKVKSSSISEKLSPTRDPNTRKNEESEGIRFIEQLRDLTSKLERTMPKSPAYS